MMRMRYVLPGATVTAVCVQPGLLADAHGCTALRPGGTVKVEGAHTGGAALPPSPGKSGQSAARLRREGGGERGGDGCVGARRGGVRKGWRRAPAKCRARVRPGVGAHPWWLVAPPQAQARGGEGGEVWSSRREHGLRVLHVHCCKTPLGASGQAHAATCHPPARAPRHAAPAHARANACSPPPPTHFPAITTTTNAATSTPLPIAPPPSPAHHRSRCR